MTVAATILAQFGGNRFIAMTGAKGFAGDDKSLTFRIGRNASAANMVRVTLTGADDYRVEFLRLVKFDVRPVVVFPGVYVDRLRTLFTETTGLHCSL